MLWVDFGNTDWDDAADWDNDVEESKDAVDPKDTDGVAGVKKEIVL